MKKEGSVSDLELKSEPKTYVFTAEETRLLFSGILYALQVKSVTYKDEEYFQHETSWSHGEFVISPGCEGYEKHDKAYKQHLRLVNQKKVHPDNVTINIKEGLEQDVLDCYNPHLREYTLDTDNPPWEKSSYYILMKKMEQYEKFTLPVKIVVINPMGPNHDHRGSDHMDIIVPMKQMVEIEPETYDFTTLVYTIARQLALLKSHHYDNNYEGLWFCELLKGKNDFWALRVEGDHGS